MGEFNFEKYRAKLLNVKRSLLRDGIKTPDQAAELLKTEAKRLAPRDSGDTINGIRKRRRQSTVTVESWVPGDFKQNLWTNGTSPHRRPLMKWNKSNPTLYGDGSHEISGTPRWFHFATLRTRSYFKKIARKNTLKALRVST